MSAHKGKNTVKKPVEPVDQPAAPRVVAIPKTPEPATRKSERIGDILRAARMERGDDIDQIAEYLRIKPAFLVALENSQYGELPPDAYVIGFIRTYANFLGTDGKDAVDRYRYEMAGRRNKPTLVMPIPMSEGPAPSGLIMVGATIVVLLIYVLWYGISSSGRTTVTGAPPLPSATQSQTTPVPDATANTTAAAGLTVPVTKPQTAPAPLPSGVVMPPAAPGIVVTAEQPPVAAAKTDFMPPSEGADTKASSKDPAKDDKDASKDGHQIYGDPNAPSRIIIRATQSSWVMITDDSGKAIFDHVLKTGDIFKVPNKPGLSLTTGNGNGITLSLDGHELPKVATGAPHVVRNISLDPEQLTADPSATEH